MNKLLKQLKQLKHKPRGGAFDASALEKSWARVAEAIGANDMEATPSLSAMYFEYARWNASKYFSRPVAAGAFSLVMVASGWMTTVNAADSLPGETLYSVKMITEKAQLKLASRDRRAVLHTEFAGRRLQEAADLSESSLDEATSGPLVHGAIEAYKQEVSSAGESLRELKDSGDATALATATSVQQNLQAIDTAIDEVAAVSTTMEASQEVLAAKEVTKEVSDVATTVAVEVHEEEQTELSAQEVKQMFKNKLGQIEARQRFDVERLDVIRGALADDAINYDGFTVPTSDELLALEYPVVAIDSLLAEAMNQFAAGGYRSAFVTLQEIDSSLLAIEAQLAQIEITIMQARQQPLTEAAPVETTP